MDKKKIEIIATSILAVVFIIVWANAIKAIKKRGKPVSTASSVVAPNIFIPKSDEKSDIKPLWTEEKDLTWLRCPFSGKSFSGALTHEVINLKLTGILWDEESPQAVINNRILGIGDRIGNNEILDINQDLVILFDGNRNFELRVGQ